MNNKEIKLYKDYIKSDVITIYNAYKRPSEGKVKAFQSLMGFAASCSGYRIRIPLHDKFKFSFAFMHMVNGRPWLYYITRNNKYHFPIEEDEVNGES